MALGKELILSLFGGFVACACAAVVAERPMPNDTALAVGGAPKLFWSVPGDNLLSNGGFEEGTNGWGAGVVAAKSPVDAFEGTNYLRRGGPIGLSPIIISRTVTLPSTLDRIIWSFAERGAFPDGLLARVLTPGTPQSQQLLLSQSFEVYGWLNSQWSVHSVDVSELAGQTVVLQIYSPPLDGMYLDIDDVRITALPPALEYDVYLDGIGLGRTTNNWWQLKDLAGSRLYKWRVDVVETSATNRGPAWTFTTSVAGSPTNFGFAEIPSLVCPDASTLLQAFLRDDFGLRVQDQSRIQLSVFAQNVELPRVLISEVKTGNPDSIELMNVSASAISLNGWSANIYGPSNSVALQTIRFPMDAVLAPGEICTITEGVASAWPNLGMTNVNWGDSGVLQAGVMLRAPLVNLLSNNFDCVFIDLTASTSAIHNIHLRTMRSIDWLGAPITNAVSAGETYQRAVNRDRNVREDWTAAAESMGALNSNLRIPFDLSYGRLNVEWTNQYSTIYGLGRTATTRFPAGAKQAVIYATLNINPGFVQGVSGPFDVVEPENCLALLGPVEAREDAGSVELRVVLGAPAVTDVIVNLRSSHPYRASVPDTVTVSAGKSEAIVTAQILNNDLLEGRGAMMFFAEAPDYSPATLPVKLLDDEIATLRIVGPLSVVEGARTPIAIEVSRAPDTNVMIHLTSNPERNVQARLLEAGQTQTTFEIFNDYRVLGDGVFHLKAEFEDWVAGEADIFIDDIEPTALSIALPTAAIGEGQSGTGTVSLAEYAGRNFEVTLVSGDPTLLEATNRVVISANQESATFNFRVLASELAPGLRTVALTASSPGLESAAVSVPIFLYPPAPRLNVTLTGDGMVVVTFNAEAGMRYGVLDLTELPGGLYDGIVPEISNGVGRFIFPANNEQHYFFVTGTPQ